MYASQINNKFNLLFPELFVEIKLSKVSARRFLEITNMHRVPKTAQVIQTAMENKNVVITVTAFPMKIKDCYGFNRTIVFYCVLAFTVTKTCSLFL